MSGTQLRYLSFHIQKRLEKDKLNQAMETRALQLDHCIFCDNGKIILWGFVGDLQRYRCNECGKTFNELTNTPFAHLQSRDKLVRYADCMVSRSEPLRPPVRWRCLRPSDGGTYFFKFPNDIKRFGSAE